MNNTEIRLATKLRKALLSVGTVACLVPVLLGSFALADVADIFIATNHVSNNLLLIEFFNQNAVPGISAVTQDCHLVAQLENFFQLMADEKNGRALIFQPMQQVE